jgi:hypothetical protein
MTTIKGFKGFDKDLKCRSMQFEVGKEFQVSGKVECCNNGIHGCENPLDVLNYYKVGQSRYCIVEGSGEIDQNNEDSKFAVSKIKIIAEIGIKGIIESAVKFIFEKVKISKETIATSGYNAHSATSGDNAHSATSGDNAHSATSGCNAHSATSGDNANSATSGCNANSEVNGSESIAAAIGINSKAKGALNCWIVLSEWIRDAEYNWHIKTVKTTKIDGKKILPDTWYSLKDGKFIINN